MILQNLIALILILMSLLSCSGFASSKKDDSSKKNNLFVAALALTQVPQTSTNCSKTAETPIANSLSWLTTESRVKYSLSECDSSKLSELGLSVNSLDTLKAGTSVDSKIISNSDMMHTSGSTNIEVTFTLTDSTGHIDIYAYSDISGFTISGPAFRVTKDNVQYKKTDGSFATCTKTACSNLNLTIGSQVTYCLEFQIGKTGGSNAGVLMLNGWSGACKDVPSSQRGPTMSAVPIMIMSGMSGMESTKTQKKLGIVLNKAKLSNFIIGSIISEIDY